jgi:tRNA threonylcarbamoyladenosine biosynthesis protein TsaB
VATRYDWGVSEVDFKWLLIDSCGATATLAIGRGEIALATESVAGRAFSAEWPAALRRLLAIAGWKVDDVQVVGVVHGPGSFTGVRVGLAAAKGLCETSGAKLIAVSRLEMLAARGIAGGLAVLDAGRDEFYVRDTAEEFLVGREEFLAASQGRCVVTADARIAEAAANSMLVELEATSALLIVLKRRRVGCFDDLATVDANYVRGERDIYAQKPAVDGSAR